MLKKRPSNKIRLLKYLEENGSITKLESRKCLGLKDGTLCGCVSQLRSEGYTIVTDKKIGDVLNCKYILLTQEQAQTFLAKPKYSHKNNKRLHAVWLGAKDRCLNPNGKEWKWYGERGITICKEWKESFQAFAEWAYANGYDENAPKGQCTLDRIDNDGNYEPSNCRWVDVKTQSNNRSTTLQCEAYGETHSVAEWGRISGVSVHVLYDRISKGWDMEKALSTPYRRRKNEDKS